MIIVYSCWIFLVIVRLDLHSNEYEIKNKDIFVNFYQFYNSKRYYGSYSTNQMPHPFHVSGNVPYTLKL